MISKEDKKKYTCKDCIMKRKQKKSKLLWCTVIGLPVTENLEICDSFNRDDEFERFCE